MTTVPRIEVGSELRVGDVIIGCHRRLVDSHSHWPAEPRDKPWSGRLAQDFEPDSSDTSGWKG